MNEAGMQNVLLSGPPGSTRIQYSILRASASLLRVVEYRGLRRVCRLISPFFSRNNSAVIEQNGLRLRIYLNDAYWVRYALCGFSYEAEFAPVLDELLDPRAIFLDCGANIGYWSVYAATRIGSSNRVVAVEPSGRTFARLLENSELNGRSFTAVRKAVYSRSGEKVRLQVDPARHESNSIVPHRLALAQGYRSELVDSVTIDDLFESVPIGNAEVSNVVVKLDVEGSEREAFRGARRLIDCGAIFIYEDHGSDPKCANTDFLLNALGLEIHFLDGRMKPLQIRDLKQLVGLKTCSTRGYNLVAARRESPALTRLLKAYSSQQARGRDGSGDPANPHQQEEIVAVAPSLQPYNGIFGNQRRNAAGKS
jgi:FkbM family methyltransferase